MIRKIQLSGENMKKALFAMIGFACASALSAHAREQVLSCNFNKPKDQKYFTDSSRIDKKHPALRLNLDRAEMYPSRNLGTINGLSLHRIALENFVMINGSDGDIGVKYFIPNEILGQDFDDVKIQTEVRWAGQKPYTEMFTLNCDSRSN
jgi:hypothetical protein